MHARRSWCLVCGRALSAASKRATEGPHELSGGQTRAAASAASTSGQSSDPQVTAAVAKRFDWRFIGLIGATGAGALAAASIFEKRRDDAEKPDPPGQVEGEDDTVLLNWSGTHECRPRRFFQPATQQQLEHLVKKAHKAGEKLRCVGSALSPNGLAFSEEGLVSLQLMDKILDINLATHQVKVQAGVRVQDLVDQLRPHGLTLQNFASIREQTIGGFIQVSAHGTGAGIPPVDEQVVGMTLITPAEGTLTLSDDQDPKLFRMARVGLGALGMVADVTLQCVPVHRLLEHTYVASVKEVRRKHHKWLRSNRHLRYMWIPYTDAVVVVTNNIIAEGVAPPKMKRSFSQDARVGPMRALLMEDVPECQREEVWQMSWTELRDRLIALRPLDAAWIKRVNQAEAEFWKRSEGYRVGYSDELLGFDCGGQQWVLEVCFPTGTLQHNTGADLGYMADLMQALEAAKVPAPSPIEQRWTSSSLSPLSPAHSLNKDDIFSWVGIIMYLGTDDPHVRNDITASFAKYAQLEEAKIMPKYKAVEHWAKLEVDRSDGEALKKRIQLKYPTQDFTAVRQRLDPKNILTNHIVEAVFPVNSQTA
ncbi:hypothetical protein WJX73_001185 [Symbiochloris irregularis]|uniref:FAD-binding PCMH-type domain-containing protein n=1 Tax=Symbiochloris irregularis TaxID=706552 RepID=A0AAW1NU11_9CHLO